MPTPSVRSGRFCGPEYQIQQSAVTMGAEQRILYLYINYTIDQNGKIQPYYDASAGSGTYLMAGGIQSFIGYAYAGNIGNASNTGGPQIPWGSQSTPVIDHPTWVVFALPQTPVVSFYTDPQTNAVTTSDGKKGSLYSPDYYNVVHIFDSGAAYSPPDTQVPGGPCHLLYFQAPYSGDAMVPSIDFFNLNVLQNGARAYVDPAIKNKGHPPPAHFEAHNK